MKIAIIGCGEVGGAYARSLRDKATLSLCDILDTGRPRQLADELGKELHPEPGDWLRECDFAVAAVPGRESAVAAKSALPFMSQGSVYIDVSTGGPDSLRTSGELFKEAGRSFVDTAILGAIDITGGKTPVLIAGDDAARAEEVFRLMVAPSRVLEGGRPGDAVALKLLRSVVVKNIECAAVECLTAAEVLGVRDQLMGMFADIDAAPFADLLSSLSTTHILHAERRMHEMEESAAQLKSLGFDAAVTGALHKRYEATLAARETSPPDQDVDKSLDTALKWLIDAGRATPEG